MPAGRVRNPLRSWDSTRGALVWETEGHRRLRREVRRHGLAVVARHAHVTVAAASAWFRGVSRPGLEEVIALAQDGIAPELWTRPPLAPSIPIECGGRTLNGDRSQVAAEQ